MKAYLDKLCKQGDLDSKALAKFSEKIMIANRNMTIRTSKMVGSIHKIGGSYIFSLGMLIEIKKPKAKKK